MRPYIKREKKPAKSHFKGTQCGAAQGAAPMGTRRAEALAACARPGPSSSPPGPLHVSPGPLCVSPFPRLSQRPPSMHGAQVRSGRPLASGLQTGTCASPRSASACGAVPRVLPPSLARAVRCVHAPSRAARRASPVLTSVRLCDLAAQQLLTTREQAVKSSCGGGVRLIWGGVAHYRIHSGRRPVDLRGLTVSKNF